MALVKGRNKQATLAFEGRAEAVPLCWGRWGSDGPEGGQLELLKRLGRGKAEPGVVLNELIAKTPLSH